MGGTIRAESEEGVGSIFYVTLPATVIEWFPEQITATPHPLLAKRAVAIVDDNATTLTLLTRYLEYWGMQVNSYSTSAAASAGLQQMPTCDLLITDVRLGNEDGLAFADAQHVRQPNLPIILLTGIADTHLRTDRSQVGSHRTLVKPIKPLALYNLLTETFGASVPPTNGQPVAPAVAGDLGARFPLRILLAEDNMLNQKVALRMLQRLGYEADVAINGLQALRAVEGQPYDVVLMDVQMPEMDGLEATRQIRSVQNGGRHQPYIIAMTAAAMELDREKCLQAGMNDFVSKPATLEDLQRALERYLENPELT
jgi:CheY-like chemotaxis protein